MSPSIIEDICWFYVGYRWTLHHKRVYHLVGIQKKSEFLQIHPMDRSSKTLIGLIFIQLNPSQTGSWLPFKINTIFQIKLHIPHPLGVYCNTQTVYSSNLSLGACLWLKSASALTWLRLVYAWLQPETDSSAQVRLIDCLGYYIVM